MDDRGCQETGEDRSQSLLAKVREVGQVFGIPNKKIHFINPGGVGGEVVPACEGFSSVSLEEDRISPTKERCQHNNRWYRIHGRDKETGREWESLIHGRCKNWDCGYCAKKNTAALTMRLEKSLSRYVDQDMKGLDKRYGLKLWSFTLPGPWRALVGKQDAIKRGKKALSLVMQQLKRKLGDFGHVWVVEPHRTDGYPHFHVITAGKNQAGKEILPLARELWCVQQRMGNLDVQAKPYSAKRAARYVSKYISKGLLKGGKKKHVYGISQNLNRAYAEVRPEIHLLEWGTWSFLSDGSVHYSKLGEAFEDTLKRWGEGLSEDYEFSDAEVEWFEYCEKRIGVQQWLFGE